ncbi:MAG: oligosaccharide flippase family protein [Bacilli bacterium]|nr:oligosaccharide flippase family protein [Bacilli bacterium]
MKNAFIKSTVILMLGSLITKVLGFVIKIIFTRIIGEGINLYSLIMPTYSLLIAITQLGLPYAVSAIMARNNYRGIKVFSSITPIALLFNIVIIVSVFIFAPYLANNLLKNPDAYYPIISICFILPFTTISGILKGYYFGKQNMFPNAISNIFEQITRLILLLTLIPFLMRFNIVVAVSGYIIISAASELVQIFIYLFFAPKNLKFTLHDIKPSYEVATSIFGISIPNVSGRLIGNICYFFEPIILTNLLLFVGYSNNFILSEYGIYNAYVIPILTMPSFFTLALNTTLIPEISKNYRDKSHVRKRLIQSLIISGLIGLLFCIYIFFQGDFILKVLYATDKGSEYLKVLSIFFPLFYLEGPLVSTLQGLNMSAYTMKVTLIGCIIKLLSMAVLCLFSIGIYSLIISEIIDIIIVISLNSHKLHQLNYL